MEKGWDGLNKLVSWYDLARGVGQVVFHSIFDQVHHDPILLPNGQFLIEVTPSNVDTLLPPGE